METTGSPLYPCEPWPINPECCPDWPDDPTQWTDRHYQAQWLATIRLWRAVAGAIGLCRISVRPCLDECQVRSPYSSSATQWMRPYMYGGQWFNNACGCDGGCSCARLCTVTLPGPVWKVEQIVLEREVLPADSWRLITGDRVARIDGQCWPVCQDFTRPDCEGFTVTYLQGVCPGPDAIRAVSLLACRYLPDCGDGSGECGDIPANATSVSRQGFTMNFDDDIGDGLPGRFSSGIRFVDDWVASINPYHVPEFGTVWSADVEEPYVYQRGWPHGMGPSYWPHGTG